jgi:hypothetical protein
MEKPVSRKGAKYAKIAKQRNMRTFSAYVERDPGTELYV